MNHTRILWVYWCPGPNDEHPGLIKCGTANRIGSPGENTAHISYLFGGEDRIFYIEILP